jgi:hypothetical protein
VRRYGLECTYLRCLDTKRRTILNGSDGQRQTKSGLIFNGMMSSAACQFSEAIVSAGEEAGREQREYKRKGNDHEERQWRTFSAWTASDLTSSKLGESTRHCSLLPLTPFGLWGSPGQQKRRAMVPVLPDAVFWAIAWPGAHNPPWNELVHNKMLPVGPFFGRAPKPGGLHDSTIAQQ